MTCILPPDKHANNLIIVKGNIRNNTFIKTVQVDNAGEEKICYCGDPASEYHIPLPNNTSSNDEGLYKCIFYYNGSETFRHKIKLYVMPKIEVSVKEDIDQHRRYFYINRTRTMKDDEVSVKAIASGVNLGDYPLITENNNLLGRTVSKYSIFLNLT